MNGAAYFAGAAAAYAEFRPHYPAALFAFLADTAPARAAAWDCATGTGQAALGLARHFSRVLATDVAAEQIAHATPHAGVTYRVAPAEASGLEDRSVELVTVAQAAHWLDRPAFYAEARRVLVPHGVIALWSYGRISIAPAIDAVLRTFHDEIVGPFWLPERRLVEEGYRTIDLPFAELPAPDFPLERRLTPAGLAGYIRTWSATRAYIARYGRDPVDDLVAELTPVWGESGGGGGPGGARGGPGGPDATVERVARWPLALRVGSVP